MTACSATFAGIGAPRADAGSAGGLCKMDTARGAVPGQFPVDACVSSADLVVRNNLTVALTPVRQGDLSGARTTSSDLGLAALATRAVASDEQLLLPGDRITWTLGPGAAQLNVAQSKHGGFYALATTVAMFLPGKKNGAVGAFAALIKELDDDFTQYRNCLDGKNWIGQLGCRALFVRNVEFAIGRAAVSGLAKEAVSAVLSGATFTEWASGQVPDTRKVIFNRDPIRIMRNPNPPTPTPTPTATATPSSATPIARSSTCADWYAATFETRKKFAGTVEPGVEMSEPPPTEPKLHEAYMYGLIFGNCDRAKKKGNPPRQVTMSQVLAGDFLETAP